jgi:endonuclease/exonuclease/phosphatase family metal-dependent hydrolase
MRPLLVASYNVHHCVGLDGRRDVDRVGEVVKNLGASVVALQEVGCSARGEGAEAQVHRIAAIARMEPVPGPTFEKKDGAFGNAVLSKLPVLAVRTLDLSFGRREPRGALDVDLDAGDRRLRVIATHLGLAPRERRHQVRTLLERVSHDDEAVTVLLGDINEWFVYGRPLRWLHARFGRVPHVRTWPAFLPVFALDRVWVHPVQALKNLSPDKARPARTASDHLPVVATLDW